MENRRISEPVIIKRAENFEDRRVLWSGKPMFLPYCFRRSGTAWTFLIVVIEYVKLRHPAVIWAGMAIYGLLLAEAMFQYTRVKYYITDFDLVVLYGKRCYCIERSSLASTDIYSSEGIMERLFQCRTVRFIHPLRRLSLDGQIMFSKSLVRRIGKFQSVPDYDLVLEMLEKPTGR